MKNNENFLWGAASAATQVEGAYDEDGKVLSIWDVSDGHIKNNETCHTACDHYHRFIEDIQLMKKIGINSYRFSVNMCRVLTDEDSINQKGLDFYKDLVRELRKNGIEPICTLYHWDLPVWAEEKGGWKNEKIQEWYLTYVKAIVNALKEDVSYFMTFNEPQMFIMAGYVMGSFAPYKHHVFSFRKHHLRNMLMAHGRAVRLIRELTDNQAKIGIAMAASAYIPDSEKEEDIQKAYEHTFESRIGEGSNSLYMDPIALGKATKMMKRALSKKDLDIICEPIDFIGLNVYQPNNMIVDDKKYRSKEKEKTQLDWVVDERCLYWTIRFFYERYQLPIMISENGIAVDDHVENGECHDKQRCEFLKKFVASMMKAKEENYPLIGYQYWSIMDNFEWNEGYTPRFGLIHVDYETQKRTLKDSAYVYQKIIEEAER